MKETNLMFEKINYLFNHNDISNKLKAKEARDLFERALKYKLNLPREEYFKLGIIYDEYVNKHQPDGIRYTGHQLIKDLNHFSHDTPDELSDNELNNYLIKLNKILETVFENKNSLISTLTESKLKNKIYSNLNNEQKDAVNSQSRITLVNAGPGTGKTHLIVDRMIRVAGISSNKKIIGLSFTNQAAISLKNKFEYKIFGTEQNKTNQDIFIGTIHSFAYNSIKLYHTEILKNEFDYEIIDEEEYNEIKKDFKNNKTYILNYLIENKLLTFEKILKDFKTLLEKNIEFKNYIANSIQEIIIDEAQDLSKIQYNIFYELYNHSTILSLYLVGDQRQNIFDFIGGDIKNLIETFENENITEYNLIESYRCPDKVLQFVNSFVFNDCTNINLKNRKFLSEKPVLLECPNKSDEAIKISSKIKKIIEQESVLNDIAILAPSSYYFDTIADSLNKENIPFKVFGGETFLDSKIRFLINLLKSTLLNKKYSLLKVVSFWDSNIVITGQDFNGILNHFTKNRLFSSANNPKLFLSLKFINQNINASENIDTVLENFISFCYKHSIFDKESIKLYESFLNVIKDNKFDDIEIINANLTPNNDDFIQFYKKPSNIKYKDTLKEEYLTVSTIHSAKGKEWNFIFIPGLTQDIFPRYNSEFNTELKKFYVACTRTKTNLFLSRPNSYRIPKKDGFGYWNFTKPKSIFFKNAIPEFVTRVNNNF